MEKDKHSPFPSTLQLKQNPLFRRGSRRLRSPISFRARATTRASLTIFFFCVLVFVWNATRCAKHGCIARTGSHSGESEKKRGLGHVGGGAVIPMFEIVKDGDTKDGQEGTKAVGREKKSTGAWWWQPKSMSLWEPEAPPILASKAQEKFKEGEGELIVPHLDVPKDPAATSTTGAAKDGKKEETEEDWNERMKKAKEMYLRGGKPKKEATPLPSVAAVKFALLPTPSAPAPASVPVPGPASQPDVVKAAPAEDPPTKVAPVEAASVDVAPAVVAPAEAAPVELSPAAVAPMEVPPLQNTPVEDTLVEVAPVAVAPAAVVPAVVPAVAPAVVPAVAPAVAPAEAVIPQSAQPPQPPIALSTPAKAPQPPLEDHATLKSQLMQMKLAKQRATMEQGEEQEDPLPKRQRPTQAQMKEILKSKVANKAKTIVVQEKSIPSQANDEVQGGAQFDSPNFGAMDMGALGVVKA